MWHTKKQSKDINNDQLKQTCDTANSTEPANWGLEEWWVIRQERKLKGGGKKHWHSNGGCSTVAC